MSKLKAEVRWARGRITAASYPVLYVATGRESQGRNGVVLSVNCAAYEENPEAVAQELHDIAAAINEGDQCLKSSR